MTIPISLPEKYIISLIEFFYSNIFKFKLCISGPSIKININCLEPSTLFAITMLKRNEVTIMTSNRIVVLPARTKRCSYFFLINLERRPHFSSD
jgi:hypothetical protein